MRDLFRALRRRPVGAAGPQSEDPKPERGAVRRGRGVVLLEDDAQIRELVIEGLEQNGFGVTATASPDDAVAAINAAGGRAVLIADRSIDRDGPTGFRIAEQALERHPELRAIYISGTHLAIRRRALGKRERALMKPFAIAQLVALVRDLSG